MPDEQTDAIVDADTGEVVAEATTDNDNDDLQEGGQAEIVADTEEAEAQPSELASNGKIYASNGKDYVTDDGRYGREENGLTVYLSTEPRPGAIYPETPAADGFSDDADSKGAGEGS
jgi:hypothetical protein